MWLLFFSVSLIFSFIFYSFFELSQGKDIYGALFTSPKPFSSLTGNLFFETVAFFLAGLVLFFLFSNILKRKNNKKNEFLKNYYFLYWALFSCMFVFPFIFKDNFILLAIIFFIFWESCFHIISERTFFQEQKVSIKYFGLALNYLSVLTSLFYLVNIGFSLMLFAILGYSIVFNYLLHKQYTNYVSLFVSGIISLFLLFFWVHFFYLQILAFL